MKGQEPSARTNHRLSKSTSCFKASRALLTTVADCCWRFWNHFALSHHKINKELQTWITNSPRLQQTAVVSRALTYHSCRGIQLNKSRQLQSWFFPVAKRSMRWKDRSRQLRTNHRLSKSTSCFKASRALLTTFVFAKWWAFEAASCPRNQTLNEDNTFNLHVTPPLCKHFVSIRAACTVSIILLIALNISPR